MLSPLYRHHPALFSGSLCLDTRQPRLSGDDEPAGYPQPAGGASGRSGGLGHHPAGLRSEEHTSELQSRENIVCLLLLEIKILDDVNNGDDMETETYIQH